jgi:hypothetical protein
MHPLQRLASPEKAASKAVDHPTSASQGPSLAPPAFQLQASSTQAPVQMAGSANLKRGGSDHTIEKGDNPWDLSKKIYGHTRYFKQIQDANPGRTMIPGEVWKLPLIEIPIGTALNDQKGNDKGLRDLAVSISDADYDEFRWKLSQDDIEAQGNFLQIVDMMRSTKMTMAEMTAVQKGFMEAEAKKAGMSVGEYVNEEMKDHGFGGGDSPVWDATPPKEKAEWKVRFQKVVKKIEASAPESIQEIIKKAKAKGGRFSFDPADTEKGKAFAFTENDFTLHCGIRFVEAAEKDVESVYANIAHEMGGHNEYGHENAFDIAHGAFKQFDPAEQAKGLRSGNSLSSVYGYPETELWAELREDEFDRADNPTDRPFLRKENREPDVRHQLERIKKLYEPKIAEGLVRSLVKRAKDDSRITVDTYGKFLKEVKSVFGLDL